MCHRPGYHALLLPAKLGCRREGPKTPADHNCEESKRATAIEQTCNDLMTSPPTPMREPRFDWSTEVVSAKGAFGCAESSVVDVCVQVCDGFARMSAIDHLKIGARCCDDLLHPRQNLLSRGERAVHGFAYYLERGVGRGLRRASACAVTYWFDLHWHARELNVELGSRHPGVCAGNLHPNRLPESQRHADHPFVP